MRAVFFLQGERVPAARARGLALARWLTARGVSCDLRIPHPSVYGDTRLPAALAWPRPLYAQLAPPNLSNIREDPLRVKRAETHGWDVGRWFSQPCVIIMGQLVDTESPTPLLVNGQPVKSRGRTVVRWVYPMPDNPPQYPEAEPPAPGADGTTPAPPAPTPK